MVRSRRHILLSLRRSPGIDPDIGGGRNQLLKRSMAVGDKYEYPRTRT